MTHKKQRTEPYKPAPDAQHLFNDTAKSVGFDYQRYAHLLDETGYSEAEKQELLSALWNIITQFVQLGFGIHPIQQAQSDTSIESEKTSQKDGGKVEISTPLIMANMLNSNLEIGGQ